MNIDKLKSLNLEINENASLADYTTFQLGGRCPLLISCSSSDQITALLSILSEQKEDFILIGIGSNLVISDKGIDRTVVRYASNEPRIEMNGSEIVVEASTLLDDLALYCAENSLAGLNFSTGIPGTVGGAICGNAGAFGKQISDCLISVDLISREGVIKRDVDPNSLDFSYRDSSLKRSKDIVVSAKFNLQLSDSEVLLKERKDILELRKEKHPDYKILPSAGSFFRNVESTSNAGRRQAAGWYLEQAGAKDLNYNGATTFESHANIIVKNGDCSAQDVCDLSDEMHRLVKEKFYIDLIREVRFVGDFQGKTNKKSLIW